jgi:[acyl-carrier-protein] S-malonyltransferase
MGADVFATRPDLLGEAADAVLGWSLARLCAEGPEEDLTRTERAQPALYAVAFALWEAFAAAVSAPPAAAAGHSLGEYTALAAAGVFDYTDGLRIVARRGAAMAKAADLEPSGMAALLGADAERAGALAAACRDAGGRLWVANLNAPGQVVVAGGAAGLEWAAEHGRDHGIRRVIPLKVAGAFHSPLMAPAAEDLGAAVAGLEPAPAVFPVWSNVTAEPHGGPEEVAAALVDQLTSPVRFEDTLRSMAGRGISTFVHIGPGDVTAGLVRRSIEDGETYVVSTLAEAAEAAAVVGSG